MCCYMHLQHTPASKELNKGLRGQMVTLSNQEVGKRSRSIKQNIGMRLLWRQVQNFTHARITVRGLLRKPATAVKDITVPLT